MYYCALVNILIFFTNLAYSRLHCIRAEELKADPGEESISMVGQTTQVIGREDIFG